MRLITALFVVFSQSLPLYRVLFNDIQVLLIECLTQCTVKGMSDFAPSARSFMSSRSIHQAAEVTSTMTHKNTSR